MLFQHVGYQSVLTSMVTLLHNYDSLFCICSSFEFSCNLVDSNRLPRDIQKATRDFTTSIGEGAFGPVYKAQMATGETVAVKVLATNSRQGKNDFLSEVLIYIGFI
jgi:hypothetical protein